MALGMKLLTPEDANHDVIRVPGWHAFVDGSTNDAAETTQSSATATASW